LTKNRDRPKEELDGAEKGGKPGKHKVQRGRRKSREGTVSVWRGHGVSMKLRFCEKKYKRNE